MRPNLASIVKDMRWLAGKIYANQDFEIMADFDEYYIWITDIKSKVEDYFINKIIKKLGIKNKNNEEFYIGDFVEMDWKGQKLIGEIIGFCVECKEFNIRFYPWYIEDELIEDFSEENMEYYWINDLEDLDKLKHVNKKDYLGLIKDINGKPYSIGDVVSSCNSGDSTSEDARFDIGDLIDFNVGECKAILKNRFAEGYIYLEKDQLEKATIIGHEDKVTDNKKDKTND